MNYEDYKIDGQLVGEVSTVEQLNQLIDFVMRFSQLVTSGSASRSNYPDRKQATGVIMDAVKTGNPLRYHYFTDQIEGYGDHSHNLEGLGLYYWGKEVHDVAHCETEHTYAYCPVDQLMYHGPYSKDERVMIPADWLRERVEGKQGADLEAELQRFFKIADKLDRKGMPDALTCTGEALIEIGRLCPFHNEALEEVRLNGLPWHLWPSRYAEIEIPF